MLNAAKIGVLGGWKKRRKLCCPAHNAPVSKAALAQVRLNLAHLGCRPLEVPDGDDQVRDGDDQVHDGDDQVHDGDNQVHDGDVTVEITKNW